jgi:hypothetical protein
MAAAMNAKMVYFAPELASEYAEYPMSLKFWLQATDTDPKGEPCYIAAPPQGGQVKLKPNYVFGPGPRGFGYYHLLTRSSYRALYARMTHENPVSCCSFSKAARDEYYNFDDVKRIVFARSRSRKPDDGNTLSYDAKQQKEAYLESTHLEQLTVAGTISSNSQA